ncbi:hypothetical protein N9937_00330 [bacterium]|nr:hypothetical protein [bacterium]
MTKIYMHSMDTNRLYERGNLNSWVSGGDWVRLADYEASLDTIEYLQCQIQLNDEEWDRAIGLSHE